MAGPTAALANKSFFKADKVNMEWNKKGETAARSVPLTETEMAKRCRDRSSHQGALQMGRLLFQRPLMSAFFIYSRYSDLNVFLLIPVD